MVFVSEFISPDDVARYDILSIDRKFLIGGTNARDWVIDREREIYLRNVAHGGGSEPEICNQTHWTFYWRGELLTLRLDMLESGGERKGAGWSRWMLIWINGGKGLPAHLKSEASQIIEDLGVALTAHKGFGGVHSNYIDYNAEIEISEGCAIW
ncbi:MULTISPECIES: hypothetical protein [unclassified Xanthomonas]|uniref:hypothetical protein n=1 Tax=unclassified Xanthomonas TaxID=2643310 RepID=UPI002B23D3D0|nr:MULTISPECIES: hypothetical protein [unclassified Xanthomonas]MEA9562694.1 hypothetical protein [Xanthomonas sp. WHRI 8932A]MEA9633747.1 hypothetical protein [Xanthomonas sp. WHRI 8812E]